MSVDTLTTSKTFLDKNGLAGGADLKFRAVLRGPFFCAVCERGALFSASIFESKLRNLTNCRVPQVRCV